MPKKNWSTDENEKKKMKQATGARITVLEDDTNLTKITKITSPTKITSQGSDRHKRNKCSTQKREGIPTNIAN